MTTFSAAGEGKPKSRFQISPVVMGGLTIAMGLASTVILKDTFGNDPVAAVPAGVVYRVEPAPIFEPHGLWSWITGETPVDRSYIVTDKERHLANYVASFPIGASVEVRDTISAGRQICTIDGAHCSKLWHDQSQLITVDESGIAFSLVLKLAGALAALSTFTYGLMIALRFW